MEKQLMVEVYMKDTLNFVNTLHTIHCIVEMHLFMGNFSLLILCY